MIAAKNEQLELKAEKREISGKKVKNLRTEGKVPAVVYGKEIPPVVLALDARIFGKIYKQSGESTILQLNIEGEKEARNVLITETQFHPVTDEILHVDFYQVRMDEKIKTEVPLKVVGESPAVENLNGVLLINQDEVEVESLPGNLPHEIEVDISFITELDQAILVKNLKLPSGVEVTNDPEATLIVVQSPRSEEEMAELDKEVTEDVDSVGVEEKGKEDGEAKEGETKEGEAEAKGENKPAKSPADNQAGKEDKGNK